MIVVLIFVATMWAGGGGGVAGRPVTGHGPEATSHTDFKGSNVGVFAVLAKVTPELVVNCVIPTKLEALTIPLFGRLFPQGADRVIGGLDNDVLRAPNIGLLPY